MSLDTSTTSRPGCCSRKGLHHPQDLVVGLALWQSGRQRDIDQVGLEEQLSAGLPMAGAAERQAVGHARGTSAGHAGGQCVEIAAHLPRVPGDLGHAPLVAVEFFQRDHWKVDVVFLEAKQRRRVVHQHVGVQHEQGGRPGATRLAGSCRRCCHRSSCRRRAVHDRLGHHRRHFSGDGSVLRIHRRGRNKPLRSGRCRTGLGSGRCWFGGRLVLEVGNGQE